MDFIFLALWGIDIPLTHGTFHISNLFQISLLKKKKNGHRLCSSGPRKKCHEPETRQ